MDITTDRLPTSSLQQDFPLAGPALLPSGQLMMPYLLANGSYVQFSETPVSRTAPKLVKSAQVGDFAFGGLVSLDHCVQIPRAGGLGPTKKMVGRAEYVALNKFVTPWNAVDRTIRKGMPLDGAYKVLFCLAGRTDDMATDQMATSVDMYRRAWDIYSPLLMDRNSDTNVV